MEILSSVLADSAQLRKRGRHARTDLVRFRPRCVLRSDGISPNERKKLPNPDGIKVIARSSPVQHDGRKTCTGWKDFCLEGVKVPVNNSSVGQSEEEQLSASRFPPGVKWEDAHGYRGGHVHTCFPRLFFFSHFHSDGASDGLIPQFPEVELMADWGH